MEHTIFSNPIVTVSWLKENLNLKNLVILDVTISNPNAKASAEVAEQIKGARFLDLEKLFSDSTTGLPHSMVSSAIFEAEAQKLGINKDSILVIYDKLGIFSSPRVWWMFKAMGHQNIAVLDGGFPEWKHEKGAIEEATAKTYDLGNFKSNFQPEYFCDQQSVLEAIDTVEITTCDARPEGRFCGTTPEPRPGLRGGHIPNSVNIPFPSIVKEGKMVSKEALEKGFEGISKSQKLIFSCGSGVTACVLALAATILGYKTISVYDGSWSEWGIPSAFPVVEGA